MDETTRTSLIRKLERLDQEHLKCAWLWELFKNHLKASVKLPVIITIDNSYMDVKYEVLISRKLGGNSPARQFRGLKF